jgi:hypothetical protein
VRQDLAREAERRSRRPSLLKLLKAIEHGYVGWLIGCARVIGPVREPAPVPTSAVCSVLGPPLIPVTTTDSRVHLSYELLFTNLTKAVVRVQAVKVIDLANSSLTTLLSSFKPSAYLRIKAKCKLQKSCQSKQGLSGPRSNPEFQRRITGKSSDEIAIIEVFEKLEHYHVNGDAAAFHKLKTPVNANGT